LYGNTVLHTAATAAQDKLRVQSARAELQANVLNNKQNPYKNIKNKDNTIISIVFQNFLAPSFCT
jgi:hypothetical protein